MFFSKFLKQLYKSFFFFQFFVEFIYDAKLKIIILESVPRF